ncbi:hypothetical protein BOX15_Mlig026832g2, partial [Macrostomum lignano]
PSRMAESKPSQGLVHSYSRECVEWRNTEEERSEMLGKPPESLYTALGNAVRLGLSGETLCRQFCGGAACKHCDPVGRFAEDAYAVRGLHSHWVTKTILAMSRPVQARVEELNIIDQFKEQGIRAVVNLQEPGEHAHCGQPLVNGGFSYDPALFMAAGLAVYNFAWPDFTTVQFERLLDVVKVMQFAASEGSVAVHCHAGLGRTGLVIACYLIFVERLSGEEAIAYVRHRRPQSIQTQLQVDSVMDFAERIRPYLVLFPHRAIAWGHRFSYEEHMRRQAAILHGEEAKRLRYLSQLVYAVTQRLLQLRREAASGEELLNQVLSASPALDEELEGWRDSLNNRRCFQEILQCREPAKLTAFLLCWLHQLKAPALSIQNVSTLMKTQTITGGLDAVDRYTSTLVRYMALFLLQLVSDQSDDAEVDVILLFLSALTHQSQPHSRRSDFARYFIKLVDYVEGLLERRVSPELVWRDRADRLHKRLSGQP